MDDQTELLQKILETLTLIAEPQIAQRDEKLRAALRQIVGKSAAKGKAVLLMDGSRSQVEIRQIVMIDQGDLSKMVKALRTGGLLAADEKPRLTISLPPKFFDSMGGE